LGKGSPRNCIIYISAPKHARFMILVSNLGFSGVPRSTVMVLRWLEVKVTKSSNYKKWPNCVIQYHITRVSVVDEFDSGILFDILCVDQLVKVMVEVKVKVKVSQRPRSCSTVIFILAPTSSPASRSPHRHPQLCCSTVIECQHRMSITDFNAQSISYQWSINNTVYAIQNVDLEGLRISSTMNTSVNTEDLPETLLASLNPSDEWAIRSWMTSRG